MMPLLPAPPSLTEVAAAWATLGTVCVLPLRFLWHRYSRRFVVADSRTTSAFTLKLALCLMAGYATCTGLLFVALFWHGRRPSALPSAFAWAGAYWVGIALLSLGAVTIRTLHRRGYFQRWLSVAPLGRADD